MKIEAGFLKEMFSYPESAKKIRYKTKVEVNNKIKEITKYCIEEHSPLDPDSEDYIPEEEIFRYFVDSKLQGLDRMLSGLAYVNYFQAIEDEFSIDIDEDALYKIKNIESLTNVVCSELEIKE